MRTIRTIAMSATIVLGLLAGTRVTAAAGPAAPTPIAPADGGQVTVPFTISWSAVSDPSGIIAYNWQVSPASSFSPIIEQNSTNGATQDTVSGLANGTYFWRVQAVNGSFVQGAWSAAQRFTVTGANAGEPGSPTLNPPRGGTAFHPMEVISFNWSAVSGAASYTFDASTDPTFPIANEIHFNNIPNTSYSLDLGDSEPQGTWYVRVSAVSGSFTQGVPSNTVSFTLSFNAPPPPAPMPRSPASGSTVSLPVTMTWTDVPNPQPSGYVLEIADDPGFSKIEYVDNQITGAHWTVTSLPAGTKYWHVLSTQGDSAPGVPANTAWSATSSFVVPSSPPAVGSVSVAIDPASAGDTQTVTIQLTGPTPAGGAVVNLTSSDPNAAPVPATFTMPAGLAFGQFRFQVGGVTALTPVSLTASLNSTSASVSFTVRPPTLKSISMFSPITGGATTSATLMLTGAAPAGGAVVSLSSNSPAVSPPATATIAAGNQSVAVNVPTSAVSANTTVTITASWNGVTVQTQLTLTPQQPPASLTLNPASVSGTTGSFGTVSIASASTLDVVLPLTSTNPSVARIPNSVTIPAGSTRGGFNITTATVTTQTVVTISVSGAGVTQAATLTVSPASAPTPTPAPTPSSGVSLSTLTLSPSNVRSGDSSTGTVTLSGPAPTTGLVVSLTSSNSALATVPPSLMVSAGKSSASFEVRTQQVSTSSSVSISATGGGVSRSATLILGPH